MDATGPTGMTGTTEDTSTGPTGIDIFNGQIPVPSEPPESVPQPLVTLDELLVSTEAAQAKETADRERVSALLRPTREMYYPALLSWASTGFQAGFQVYSVSVTPPNVCSDGVVRSIGGYIPYLTNVGIEQMCLDIQATMSGIRFFHSFLDNTLRLHVEKIIAESQ